MFNPLSSGVCHCWSELAISGKDCQFASAYAKIVCCFVFTLSIYGLLISMRLIFNVGINGNLWTLNALNTTLFQNFLSFFSASVSFGLTIDILFSLDSHSFWKVQAYYYFVSIFVSHGIGSALNLSLMWIEVAAFQQLKIVQNVHRTRNLFLGLQISLYIELLLIGVLLHDYRPFQVIAIFYVCILMLAFILGATKMAVLYRPYLTETATDGDRTIQNIAEVKRMFSTTKSICLFAVLYFCFEAAYLVTFQRNTSSLGFFTFVGFQVFFLCIDFTVLWHLKGRTLLSWDLRFFKTKVRGEKQICLKFFQQRKAINIRVIPQCCDEALEQ